MTSGLWNFSHEIFLSLSIFRMLSEFSRREWKRKISLMSESVVLSFPFHHTRENSLSRKISRSWQGKRTSLNIFKTRHPHFLCGNLYHVSSLSLNWKKKGRDLDFCLECLLVCRSGRRSLSRRRRDGIDICLGLADDIHSKSGVGKGNEAMRRERERKSERNMQ